MYVMGGVAWVETQLCGQRSCGGGYRQFLNDVWRSEDGDQWLPVTLAAAWPGRGDFGVTLIEGTFWLAGGRGGDTFVADFNPLFNDVWTSSDGELWTINTTHAAWSPRYVSPALRGCRTRSRCVCISAYMYPARSGAGNRRGCLSCHVMT